ncbi:YczE/YyaS/YitT family protein [Fusicatenibacter sp.]
MKRYLLYFAGLNLIAAMVVLNIRFGLGVAAFSSVMYSISQIYHISLGTASIICYLLFVAAQCILTRKIRLAFLLEIPLSFAFGWLTDFYDFIIPELGFPVGIMLLLYFAGMFATAMGVFLCVKTDLILTPTDGIVKTISEVFSLPFSSTKNGFDISLVLITVLLCLLNHTPIYGIGIGTILSAIFVGRIIKLYEKKVTFI